MSDMRLVVVGAAGRMGRMLVKTISETPGAKLSGAIERPGSIALGQDAGLLAGVGKLGALISDDPLKAVVEADGVIDFSSPTTSVELAGFAAQARIVHVIGTTGFSQADIAAALSGHKPGQSVEVAWMDAAGAAHTADVTLAASPVN